ncbi:hypothetical protein L6452_05871 [Arctium lappa]|uniref:Uncharacterized protein n=1 Tax=Arctium lappa TaxID=4217 RepID=A0ACB9EHN0_ARCLA|nr:hypothetical protein L6452_05871 [Arctium lappa]
MITGFFCDGLFLCVYSTDGNDRQKEGEDIAEEEVVCRICMVELREGADDTLKMECNCKGEFALAHQECAIKWFSIKGNKTCENLIDTVDVAKSYLAALCEVDRQEEVVELDFIYPSEGIHRRWDNDHYITSTVVTWDQNALS